VSLEKRAQATYAEYRRQKRACQQNVDSDYLFGNCLQRLPFIQGFPSEPPRTSKASKAPEIDKLREIFSGYGEAQEKQLEAATVSMLKG
jgi:hypothetical protein